MKLFGRPFFTFCLTSLLLLVTVSWSDVIEKSQFHKDDNGVPGDTQYNEVIDIGPGIKVNAVVDVSKRGNGILAVANLKDLKVWNEGSEGPYYINGLLRVEFVDITGDGYKDLVITGVVVDPGEKGKGPFTYSAVTRIYIFDPGKKEYKLTFSYGPQLDMSK